jgi:hypothetical protein
MLSAGADRHMPLLPRSCASNVCVVHAQRVGAAQGVAFGSVAQARCSMQLMLLRVCWHSFLPSCGGCLLMTQAARH